MLWDSSNRTIRAAYSGGRWNLFQDQWQEGMNEYSCGGPPSPPTPKRGFGLVWCRNENVRTQLGNAVAAEEGGNSLIQDFEKGRIWRWQNTGEVFVFYSNGTWEYTR